MKSWSKAQPPLSQMQKPKPGFLPQGAEWENLDGSPIQSLTQESLVVGQKGSAGRGDGQEARSRGAADFRASREAHIYCPARAMRWHTAQWLLDSRYSVNVILPFPPSELPSPQIRACVYPLWWDTSVGRNVHPSLFYMFCFPSTCLWGQP